MKWTREEEVPPVGHEDLDVLLHAWLSETNESKAAQAFTQYFRSAFAEACRYVRSLRADDATAQDISQQALVKLFKQLGTKRREADARLRAALSGLRPLDFGALHVERVHTWREQVSSFRAAAVAFRSSDGKRAREAINSCAVPLCRQGRYLLSEVRARADSALHRLISLESPEHHAPHGDVAAESQSPSGETAGLAADAFEQETVAFTAKLLRYSAGREIDSVEAAIGCPGAVEFVSRTTAVCEDLPTVAIPSNGLLYTIARRLFLNSLRSKSAAQAMFAAAVADEPENPGVSMDWDIDHPLDAMQPMREMRAATGLEHHSDESDIESRYRAFQEFLRAPLTRAEAALAATASAGSARTQQAKVDSLGRKYERLTAVLRALHDSPQPSEEEIAQKHGLSRNQVKYLIERVRSEFNHFFPELTRATQGRRKRKGVET
jgi:DNA-directed RNA polymerase specialized sigma24 family protein